MSFILGMDTGGTFTDGVILNSATGEVICKGKALTTADDLAVGIGNCMDTMGEIEVCDIDLTAISTTLATNAVVEGKGGRAALIYMGEKIEPVPAKYTICVKGRCDIMGNEKENIDEKEIIDKIKKLRGKVDAVAVSGYASVRNPRHEKLVREIVREQLDVPVVCGYQLTSALGFHHRCVTAVLNAKLIPIVDRLLAATKKMLKDRGIRAPLMIVRGDGTLMSSEAARAKPVETLLSGPAASVIGGKYLTGQSEGIIVDMGGTTTDIAEVCAGSVRINDTGAVVGGWHTRVKAAEISTFGMGGDSRIWLDSRGRLQIGPEKVIPVSRAGIRPQELDVDSLVNKGSKVNAALTPTDVLHITGEYAPYDRDVAFAAAEAVAKRMSLTVPKVIEKIIEKMVRGLALNIVQAAADFERESMDMRNSTEAMYILKRAFGEKESPVFKPSVKLLKPVIALGAPANAWIGKLSKVLEGQVIVPENAEVANAVGAAAGEVTCKSEVAVRAWAGKFILNTREKRAIYDTREEAMFYAVHLGRQQVEHELSRSGCSRWDIIEDREEEWHDIGGEEKEHVSTKLRFTGIGRRK